MEQSPLNTIIEQTRAAISAAENGLSALVAHAQQSEAELRATLEQAARLAAFAAFDPDLLTAFLHKPYLVRPLGNGRYELIVPRFFGLRAGWPLRETESYAVYEVS